MHKTKYGFEALVALRYLRAKTKQGFISLVGFLSVAGVALGVMALVIVIAVMSGAEKDFRKRILGMEPHIILNSKNGSFGDYRALSSEIKKMNGIKDVSPYLSGRVMLRSKWGLTGAIVRGVDPDQKKSIIKGISIKDMERDFSSSDKTTSIIIGKGIANTLGVEKGDTLYAFTSNWVISPVGMLPSMRELKVADIFDSGLYEYDSAIAYMKMSDIQSLLGMKDEVTGLGIYVENVFGADSVSREIGRTLAKRFWIRTWMETNRSLFSALKLEKTAMFIILTLIILVAAFNIASSLIMLVMEKTRDIAIMKTMGVTKAGIRRIFVMQGMFIGGIGISIGILLGIFACELLEKYHFIKLPDAYPFSTLPVDLQLSDVGLIAISAFLICLFSTLYPASQAAKLDPVEGIRYGE